MQDHDEGAGHVVTFLVAVAIFIPAFTLLLVFTKDSVERSGTNPSEMRAIARSSLDNLVDHPGEHGHPDLFPPHEHPPDPVPSWEEDPDNVKYVGLRDKDNPWLAASKIQAVVNGELESEPANGRLDYPEMKDKLGITKAGSTFEFHIRSFPILPSTPGNRYGSYVLTDVDVAYIGHYLSEARDGIPPNLENEYTNPHAAVLLETDALEALNVDFDDRPWRMPGGDSISHAEITGGIVADRNDLLDPDGLGGEDPIGYLDFWTANRLAGYDVVVVGSEVDQSVLAIPLLRDRLENWVVGGGTLIVLGSALQDDTWLACSGGPDCLLAAAAPTQDPLTEPDLSNPILSTPNVLAYTSYPLPTDPADDRWLICGGETNGVTLVLGTSDVAQGTPDCGQGQYLRATLAVTNANRFGTAGGRVVMTTFLPYDILDPVQRQQFFANSLVYAEIQELFFDVGPQIVESVPVESAERVVSIRTLNNALVDTRIIFYVWGAGGR